MAIGPLQLIAIGFEPTDRCQARMHRELQELHGREIIRVLDALVVTKDSEGAIARLEGSQLSYDELGPAGQALSILIGLDRRDPVISPWTDMAALAFAEHNYGLSRKDIIAIAEQLTPGEAAALLLIEHSWALRLKAAVRAAGGRMLAQSLVAPEALLWIGDEVQAIAEAKTVIELASAVNGAALLVALADVAEDTPAEEGASSKEIAAAARTAAAVQAIRALIVGGLIAEAAAKEAIGVLVSAGLIAEAAVTEAARQAEQTALENQAALIAVEEIAQGQLP
jgi:uncharacterized membrane protein